MTKKSKSDRINSLRAAPAVLRTLRGLAALEGAT